MLRKLLIASCVVNLLLLGPPNSSSPRFTLDDISSITMSEKARRRTSNSSTVTLLRNVILPVLLKAVIKSPTLKSPSSLVPDEYTRPGNSENCSYSTLVLPPFCGSAL